MSLPTGAWQEDCGTVQMESRTAILKAKLGAFLANLYEETLSTMKRINDQGDGPRFNAGELPLRPSV